MWFRSAITTILPLAKGGTSEQPGTGSFQRALVQTEPMELKENSSLVLPSPSAHQALFWTQLWAAGAASVLLGTELKADPNSELQS